MARPTCSDYVRRSGIGTKTPQGGAIAIAKRSFNADSESIRGIGGLGFTALALYYDTDESKEGGKALQEKRTPNFRRFT